MIIKEALQFIESEEMREYLQTCGIKHAIMLVVKSRASLAEKAEVLKAIAEQYPSDWGKYYNPITLADEALKALEETELAPQGSIFILTEYSISETIENDNHFMGHYVDEFTQPFISFDKAVQHIKDHHDIPNSDEDDCYIWFNIARWDLDNKGDLREAISWDLKNSHVIWGFDRHILDDISSAYIPSKNKFKVGYSHDLNLPVPFVCGDIITIDIRPFAEIFHAVIVRVGDVYDCCSPTCLYINKKGEVQITALKHLFGLLPKFSPLLRAERFNGELPEREAPLKIVSERVKADTTLGDRLLDIHLELDEKGEDMTWANLESYFA